MDPQIQDKLEETEFFLGEMEKSFQDDNRFKFMYSAFLSAGQSTLYYLISRYKNKAGFNDWYWGQKNSSGAKFGGRIESAEIKHLMNARGCIIHVEGIPLGATRAMSLGASMEIALLANEILPEPCVPKKQSDASSLAENVEPKKPTTVARWLIEEDSYMRYSKHGNIIDDTRYIPDLRRRYPADPSDPTYIDILKISRAETR
jgi:hypothetical protein